MEEKNVGTGKRILTFDNYIGQKQIIDKIKIFTKSCLEADAVLPHILFNGPRGVGKTSLASVIASEVNREFVVTIGHNLKTQTDIFNFINKGFKSGRANPILFIDEIHLIPKKTQQLFYTAMEDFIMIIKERKMESTYEISDFTLIGATTDMEQLEEAFISRFVLKFEFEYYSIADSASIAYKYFLKNNIGDISKNNYAMAAMEVGRRARGIARDVVNFAYQIKQFVLSDIHRYVSYSDVAAKEYFRLFNIDNNGLNDIDYQYLMKIYENIPNPIGISYLSNLLDRSVKFIQKRIEPWLMSLDYIKRSSSGRTITDLGVRALSENHKINKGIGLQRKID